MNEPTPGKEVGPYDPVSYAQDSERVADGFWDKVRKTLGRVPFVEEAVAAYFCAADAKTPLQVKAILVGALAYFVIPADMIPDFIAGLGFTDDAAVFYAALRTVAPHIQARHREQARRALKGLEAEAE
jgi:uncharacterized membrane protein YkvA (DUF1232 family)